MLGICLGVPVHKMDETIHTCTVCIRELKGEAKKVYLIWLAAQRRTYFSVANFKSRSHHDSSSSTPFTSSRILRLLHRFSHRCAPVHTIAHSNGEERVLVPNGGFEPRQPPGKSTRKSPVEPFFISD